jgi:hypothetical protein
MLHPQLIDLLDEILDFVTVLAVCPFTAIANTPVLVINSDGTALGNTLVGTSLNRLLEKISGVCAIVNAQAMVNPVEVDAVLESAVLGKIFRRNLSIVARHAHGETEMDSRVRIQASST